MGVAAARLDFVDTTIEKHREHIAAIHARPVYQKLPHSWKDLKQADGVVPYMILNCKNTMYESPWALINDAPATARYAAERSSYVVIVPTPNGSAFHVIFANVDFRSTTTQIPRQPEQYVRMYTKQELRSTVGDLYSPDHCQENNENMLEAEKKEFWDRYNYFMRGTAMRQKNKELPSDQDRITVLFVGCAVPGEQAQKYTERNFADGMPNGEVVKIGKVAKQQREYAIEFEIDDTADNRRYCVQNYGLLGSAQILTDECLNCKATLRAGKHDTELDDIQIRLQAAIGVQQAYASDHMDEEEDPGLNNMARFWFKHFKLRVFTTKPVNAEIIQQLKKAMDMPCDLLVFPDIPFPKKVRTWRKNQEGDEEENAEHQERQRKPKLPPGTMVLKRIRGAHALTSTHVDLIMEWEELKKLETDNSSPFEVLLLATPERVTALHRMTFNTAGGRSTYILLDVKRQQELDEDVEPQA